MKSIKVIRFRRRRHALGQRNLFPTDEKEILRMLEEYLPQHSVARNFFKRGEELPLYGMAQGFILSMIETAISRIG